MAYADISHLLPETVDVWILVFVPLSILEEFSKISGLKTNVPKTKYALFDNDIDSPDIEKSTQISKELKHLGF